MTEFLFAGSSPEDLGLLGVDAATNPNGDWYDPNYTLRSIANLAGVTSGSWWVDGVPADGSRDLWYHVEFAGTDGNTGAGNGLYACRALDGNGSVRGGLAGIDTARGVAARAVGSSGSVTGASFDLPKGGARVPLDVNWRVHSDRIEVSVWAYGRLMSQATAATSSDIGPLAKVQAGPIKRSASGSSFRTGQSEMIATDGIPTVGMRLVQRVPASQGFHEDFRGDYTSLSETDQASAILGNAEGQRESWGLSAYNGALGPRAVVAVLSRFTFSRMLGTPTKVNQFLRTHGADFDAPSRLTGLRRSEMDAWWVNPATGEPWITDDFVNLEVGVRVTD